MCNCIFYINPDGIAEYYERHEEELFDCPEVVVEDPETGLSIQLEADLSGPELIVYANGEIIDGISLEEEGEEGALELIDYYMGSRISSYKTQYEEEIEDREADILSAFLDFLNAVSDETISEDDISPDMIDLFLETLSTDYGISIYRPTIVRDAYGNEHFEEHPYAFVPIRSYAPGLFSNLDEGDCIYAL